MSFFKTGIYLDWDLDNMRPDYYKGGNERKYSYSIKEGNNILEHYYSSRSIELKWEYHTKFNGSDAHRLNEGDFKIDVPIILDRTTQLYLYVYIERAGGISIKYETKINDWFVNHSIWSLTREGNVRDENTPLSSHTMVSIIWMDKALSEKLNF